MYRDDDEDDERFDDAQYDENENENYYGNYFQHNEEGEGDVDHDGNDESNSDDIYSKFMNSGPKTVSPAGVISTSSTTTTTTAINNKIHPFGQTSTPTNNTNKKNSSIGNRERGSSFDYFNYDNDDDNDDYYDNNNNFEDSELAYNSKVGDGNRRGTWDDTMISNRTTDSPPPPPPPLGASIETFPYGSTPQNQNYSANRSDKIIVQSNNRTEERYLPDNEVRVTQENPKVTPTKSPNKGGPFPFLKKNTRKEPSAIHRLNSPSPVKQNDSLAKNTTTSNEDDSSKLRNKGATNANIKLSDRQQKDSDYWGESTLHQDLRSNGIKQNLLTKDFGPPNNKAKSIGGSFEWDVQGELAEFEKYEKQAQMEDDEGYKTRSGDSHSVANKAERSGNEYATKGKPLVDSSPNSNKDRTLKSTQSWGSVTQPTFPNTTPDNIKRGYASTNQNNTFAPKLKEEDDDFELDNQPQDANTYHQLKLIRPVSTLKKDSRQSNNQQQTPKSIKGGEPAGGVDKTQKLLEAKAKELQEQLEAYRTENLNLKKIKKQQEQALADIIQKKEEVNKICEDERLKTMQWCEEQKQLIEKEKRTAAKQVRDMKMKATTGPIVPIRKEKAEMEALQATIEKMKVDHDTSAKKWKLNENRLYGLIRDHSQHIDNLEKQLMVLEQQKIVLLDFIAQSGLRLPKNIRQSLLSGETDSTSPPSNNKPTGKFSRSSRISGDKGYAEEVDIEVYPALSNYHHSDIGANERVDKLLNRYDDQERISPGQRKAKEQLPGEVFTRLSTNLKSGNDLGVGSRFSNPSHVLESRSSWARSSRSSGRYSESAEDDDQEQPHENVGTINNGTTAHVNKNNQIVSDQSKYLTERTSKEPGANNNNNTKGDKQKQLLKDHVSNQETHGSNSERVEDIRPDGSRVIKYRNGTIKEVDSNGKSLVIFTNGDTKHSDPTTGVVTYFYAQAKTTHITFKDGTELYEFPNGQAEKHFPDGRKEVAFPDNTRKTIFPSGIQETLFPDGVVLKEHPDGRKEILEKSR